MLDKQWDEASVSTAAQCLDEDFHPIGDMRASAAYRALTARNLLQRFYLETSETRGGKALTRVGQVKP